MAGWLDKLTGRVIAGFFFVGYALGFVMGFYGTTPSKQWEKDVDYIARRLDEIIADPAKRGDICKQLPVAVDRLSRSDECPARLKTFLEQKYRELCQ